MEQYRGLWVRNNDDKQIIDECTWHYNPGFAALQREPSVIIDIGAHIGGFVAEARRRYPHVRIMAVEPDLKNYMILKRNVDANVGLCFAACGEWNSQLYRRFEGGQVQIDEQPSAARFFGNTISLNELVMEPVDLIKFDCEGAEYNIFQNTLAGTWARVAVIVGEYHGPRERFDTLALPFLQDHFDISFYPPYNKHVGFFLGVNRHAD